MKKLTYLTILFLIWGAKCNNPAGPVSARGPILYVLTDMFPWPVGKAKIFYIDTATDLVVDSMLIPFSSRAFGVSPDGSKLYLYKAVVDTKKKRIIEGANTGVPTPDGKYLIFGSLANPTLRVIDAHSNKVLYNSDTFGMLVYGTGREFDVKRGLVYGRIQDSTHNVPTKIGVFDYKNFELIKVINPADIGGYDIAVFDIVVTKDGNKLYYTSSAYDASFTGIDLVQEKVITFQRLNWLSYLAITPDDQYIYQTDAVGPITRGECATGKIGVYSPHLEKPLEPIDVDEAICQGIVRGCDRDTIRCPTGPCGASTYHFVITPDGKKAYSETAFGCTVRIHDTVHNKVLGEILVSREAIFMISIAIQPPKQSNF